MKNRAFTLIELLVVVLIIGILAAIALPQYRIAVLKARAVEGMAILDAVEKAQIVYKMANGEFAADENDLDVGIPSNVRFTNAKNYGMITVPGGGGLWLEWVWEAKQHRCIGYSELGKKVCKSLGGVEMEHGNNSSTMQYYKL